MREWIVSRTSLMALKIETTPQGVIVPVKVVPNSSRDALAGILGDALKIKIAKPPEHGQANQALEAFLAQLLELPSSRVRVIAGHGQPRKRILIAGLDAPTVERVLLQQER